MNKDKMRKAKFPIYDEDGKFIWKNALKMDWFSILFMASVLLILLGTYPIAKYAQTCIDDPCMLCYQKQQVDAMSRKNEPIDANAIRNLVMNTTKIVTIKGDAVNEADADGKEKSIL